jgi:hypothetical protein
MRQQSVTSLKLFCGKPLQSWKAKSLWRIGLIVLFTASQLTQKANAIAVATPTHHGAQSKETGMIEVLKQMVDALEFVNKSDDDCDFMNSECSARVEDAIEAGKQAIAELENSLILTSEVNISNNFKQPQRTEQNFCPRCGKRTADLTHIHTCTPPQD